MAEQGRFDRRSIAILVALLVAEATAGFEVTMVMTALPTFLRSFKDPTAVGWLLTSYLLVSAASAAVCSRLGDIYGRRRVLLICLGLALAGTLLSAFSTGIWLIILGRAIQGMTGSVLPLCFGLARENLPKERTTYAISALASMGLISGSAGTFFGGILSETYGARSIFLFSAVLTCGALVLVGLIVPASSRRPAGPISRMMGGLTFVPAIFAILLFVSYGAHWGWTSPPSLALGIGGVVLVAAWIWRELNSAHPLLNLRLLKSRPIALCVGAMALYGLGPCQGQIIFLLFQQPTWTGIGLGLSAAAVGFYFLPAQVANFFGAMSTGVVCTRLGAGRAMILAAALMTAGWSAMLLVPTSAVVLVGAGVCLGIATPVFYSAVPNILVEVSASENTSEITGIVQVSRAAWMAIGAQLLAVLLASDLMPDPAGGPAIYPTPTIVLVGVALVAACTLGMLLCAVFISRRRDVLVPA